MIECHYCSSSFQKIDVGNIAKCCIKRCNRYFCIECINHFNPDFDMQMYKKETWICFTCQGLCTCDRCKKTDNSNTEKKVLKRRVGRPRIQGEQSIELSGSNFSQNNPKIEAYAIANPQQQELNLGFNEQDNEQQQQLIPEFKLYSEDEIIQFPPFYRKIAERRNKFYNFILKDCRKKKPISKYGREDEKYELKERQICEIDKSD